MIIYIGNILSTRGGSVAFMETLVPRLSERYEIRSASSVANKFFRLLDMALTVISGSRSANVVLIDTFSTQAFWFALAISFLCRLLGLPYLPVLRGGDFQVRMDRSPGLTRILLGQSAMNISPSLYLARELENRNIGVVYIPNFVELSKYEFTHRSNLKPRLLWVRAFGEIYNPVMAIEVLAIVRQQYPDAQLCMVGADNDGSLSFVKKRILELSLTECVTLPGRLPKTEWIALSKQYDIFLNTPHVDNMPVSVIEAMALGFPIVSTRVGGIPFLLEHENTALLTPDGDVEAMAIEIVRILKDSSLASTLSGQARQKAETFDWPQVRPQWFELLDSFETPKS
jgi:glycosyltransferase involved in cell wall biosynthesis